MTAKPILYQTPLSPAVRTVLLVADAIGLELELRDVNLKNQEHLKPEFLKMNPHHTVPTLDDNGKYIWDSHAISTYLIQKYAKDDNLYSKDLFVRSSIDQRLHFNSGVLFPALRNSIYSILVEGNSEFSSRLIKAIESAYKLLNSLFSEGNEYLVGNTITVGDYACITTVTQLEVVLEIDEVAYPNIRPWLKRMEEQPNFYDINTDSVEAFREFLYEFIDGNKKKKTTASLKKK